MHNLSNNQLSFTNGRLLLKGSDNIATDLLKLESLAGTEVFKAQNNGTIRISNAFTLPVADGTAGQALLTDGAGAVSFGNVLANNTLYQLNGSLTSDRTVDIDGNDLEILDTSVITTASMSLKTNQGFLFNRNTNGAAVVYSSNNVNHSEFGQATTCLLYTSPSPRDS